MNLDWALDKPLLLRTICTVSGQEAALRALRQSPDGKAVTALFAEAWYLQSNPDIVRSRWHPLLHYLLFGAAESRSPHPDFDAHFCRTTLVQYVRSGMRERKPTHPGRGYCLVAPRERPPRFLCMVVRHGTVRYPGAVDRLKGLLDTTLAGAEREFLVIDNQLPANHLSGNVVGGDNSAWEFSGWDQGIRHVGAKLDTFDWVLFATDAFEQFDAAFPALLTAPVVDSLRFGPAAIGNIDFANHQMEFREQRLQCWLRSSFFLLRPAEIRRLGTFVSVRAEDDAELFSGDPTHPFRAEGPLSSSLRDHLLNWLTGPGVGQGVQWHSRFELTEETLSHFEAKSRAILNELMLSARLRDLGCWLADATWLSTTPGRWFQEDWPNQVRVRLS